MINPISSNSPTPFEAAQAAHSPSAAPQSANKPPQDSVQLSSQAATGDVDHDGDSH
jgi:hypothetical protein